MRAHQFRPLWPVILNSELHLSLSAAAMSPPKPDAIFPAVDWGDPSKSELSTQPSSGSGD